MPLLMILVATIVSVVFVAPSLSERSMGLIFGEMVAVSGRGICCLSDGSTAAIVASTTAVKLFVIASKSLVSS